ncbi:hypothetical protein HMPREF9073_02946 [Capnocytophaga sp. oral taxon 326 str. F0382]|nr:hypothetical protein HMPREF9073_02946 [Capnocytophaga sp. oral taxon 326 str. F0382]
MPRQGNSRWAVAYQFSNLSEIGFRGEDLGVRECRYSLMNLLIR